MTEEQDTPYGVDWSQRFGAQCPACGVYTKESYKHAPWKPGYKVRYHVCPDADCRCRFKSIAMDDPSRDVKPKPEQLRYLREYNGKRGGIRTPARWLALPGVC